MLEFWLDPKSLIIKKENTRCKKISFILCTGISLGLATKSLVDMGFKNVACKWRFRCVERGWT